MFPLFLMEMTDSLQTFSFFLSHSNKRSCKNYSSMNWKKKKKTHQHIDGMEKAGGIVTSLKTQQCSLVTKSLWYIMMFCFHPEKRNVWLDFAFTKPLTFRHQTEQYGRRLLTVSCLRLHFFYYFFLVQLIGYFNCSRMESLTYQVLVGKRCSFSTITLCI